MDFDDRDDMRRVIALFRLQVLGDAAEDDLPRGERSRRIELRAQERFTTPEGEERSYTERTLWSWWADYKRNTLHGLLPADRPDRGVPRKITPDVLEAAISHRKDIPSRSTETLIDILEKQKLVPKGELKRSTLDRHLDHAGASRRRLKTLGDKRFIRMLFSRPNEFWLGDYHEARILWRPEVKRFRTVHMSAFIDHYSKYVPHAEWYMNETIATLEDSLKKALLKRGIPEKLYVDLGSVYRSHDFAFALDHFKIKHPRTKPYAKEAHGGIERFNRTVVEQFEPEAMAAKISDLVELNRFFEAWLEERYHLRTHEATGQAPIDRFAIDGFTPTYPDPVDVQDVFRVRVKRKVHPKMSTVEIDGTIFLVETFLRGRWVSVYYDPHRLEDVLIYLRDKRVQRALPQRPNEAPLQRPERPTASPSAFDYLGALRAEYDARLVAEARKLSLSDWRPSDSFGLPAFLELCASMLGKDLSPYERDNLTTTFQTVGPFSEQTARLALEHALKLRGRGLHVAVYTHYLKAFHLEAIRALTRK